ncbi:hypothetical protein [Phenylobacterium sp.]|nr:hypothetical protein [Phenylobacterium sp.]
MKVHQIAFAKQGPQSFFAIASLADGAFSKPNAEPYPVRKLAALRRRSCA